MKLTALRMSFPAMRIRATTLQAVMIFAFGWLFLTCAPVMADMDFDGDLGEEQMKEKMEIQDMKNEMGDVKSTINDALNQLQGLQNQVKEQQRARANAKEIHLFAREADWETYPGSTVHCLTYNGKVPGPAIRITEGDAVQIILHNQLKVPTSLHFHGLILPHSVDGLPKAGAGIVEPGGTYAFQFIPKQPGTYWYHPQVIHANQKQLGMYGALIVESRTRKPVDQDVAIVLSELVKVPTTGGAAAAKSGDGDGSTGGANFNAIALTNGPIPPANAKYDYLMNGKSAPAIAPIQFRAGSRVLLRVVNACGTPVPLHLSGHRFIVMSHEGSDKLEPQILRDTITLNPSDRKELEIMADNPGVWSLSSELAHQVTRNGKFPGGMACVIKYGQADAGGGPASDLPPEE